ncbi:MAG: DUF4417 domain-containing protein [Oscillospiraceae bacterium]|nr:DUF4417 domain-containing protein [Oscillospiraceae bacterium]
MTNLIRGRKQRFLQYDLLGKIYASDAELVGKYGFPQLEEVKALPTEETCTFNHLLSLSDPKDIWINCFCDDYQFERLWNNFYYYLPVLKQAKGFISTDFSLYRDYDEQRLIWNCYRNRVMAYASQKGGVLTIPSAGFGGENTWGWCFDGLPHHSVVAITTNGTLSDAEARRLFVGGVDALVKTIEPWAIVVCGNYPPWLETKYPDVKIVHIPSYSEIWYSRRCA